ncbi:hypothetical protein ABZ093_32020 [Streptomyces cyaneofuscatus]|uniref:hypothetical protein n=1 Tax=Streptomyces cyaneofuscatus TaxID=66883 RepID=UPI0033AC514F
MTGEPEFSAGLARGTLPAHIDGPGGRRAVALAVHDDGVVLTDGDERQVVLAEPKGCPVMIKEECGSALWLVDMWDSGSG